MAEPEPLTPSTLLPALSHPLEELARTLPLLHTKLALPPSALQADLALLRDSLLRAIDAQLERRQAEVREWEEKCQKVEERVRGLRGKLGDWSKGVAQEEGVEEQVLPRRLEELTRVEHKLAGLHAAKLEQLSLLSARLQTVAASLPEDFFPPDLLHLAPAPSTVSQAGDKPELEDVTPERFELVEREISRGKAEITARLQHLCTLFSDLLYLHTDLVLPFPSAGTSPALAASVLGSSVSTNAPSSDGPLSSCPMTSASPPAIFAQFIARMEEIETEGFEPGDDLTGMEGIDPTPDVVRWAEGVKASLEALKCEREAKIQEMYDQLEGLWRRLGVEEAEVDGFVEGNRGSSEACVLAYEAELERMQQLKREKMVLFIQNAREEIQGLWEEMMYSEEERGRFAPFYDDDHTEALLTRHETQIALLRSEAQEKAPILALVHKYFKLCDEEKELAEAAADPTRLLGKRGDAGRLLREEKMRKRVGREKPKLEKELLEAVPAWEANHDKVFLVHGQVLRELIEQSIEASEAQKENKRKPAKAAPPPAKAQPTHPQTESRKRTRTPSANADPQTAKRQKTAHAVPSTAPAAARTARPLGVATNVYETPGFPAHGAGSKLPPPSTVRSISANIPGSTTGYGKLGYGAPPPTSTAGARLPTSSAVFGSHARIPSATEERIRNAQHQAGRKGGRKESFRPRASGVGFGPAAIVAGSVKVSMEFAGIKGPGWETVREEDEEL